MKVSVRTLGRVADLDGQTLHEQLTVWLRYDPTHPYEVRLEFVDVYDDELISWPFARDLLADGMQRTPDAPAGIGDVQVWSNAGHPYGLFLRLRGDGGACVIALAWDDAARFLRRSYRQVPAGRERVDVDAAIRALLSGVD